jgi:redox-sensitive bicupin YhaK (pirin superfamily)
MSWRFAEEPDCPDCGDHLETLIIPRSRDLGGFSVRRVLPSRQRRLVGPFIFFDQMGPAQFIDGNGIDVRPHPHIGLATVTYLFDGEFQHRDSLGSDQMIRPGAVNWMIAGRGITHSERTSAATRQGGAHSLFGIQTWVALPKQYETIEPAFEHVPRDALPELAEPDKTVRLILGSAYGEQAPVKTFSPMFYVTADLRPGAKLPLPVEHEERAAYVVEGAITVGGMPHDTHEMLVFRPGDHVTITAGERGARLMLLGGESMDGPRHVWWNFVASSKDLIEAAKADWMRPDHGRFTLPPGDDAEFIPLPK